MKSFLFLLGMLLTSSNLMLMAQKQVRGNVIDKKGQPVVGASITIKGTSISTVTDIDGAFIIDNLPEDANKLVVNQIGMLNTTRTIDTAQEMKIVLHLGEKKFTPFVQGGVNFSKPDFGDDNYSSFSTGVGYTVGAGYTFACSNLLSISSSFNLMQLRYKLKTVDNDAADFNPLYVEIPVLLDLKLWLGNSRKIVMSMGPYVAFGIGGKCKTEDESIKLFSGDDAPFKRTDVGACLKMQYQTRRFSIGIDYLWGFISPIKEDASDYVTTGCNLAVGYRF